MTKLNCHLLQPCPYWSSNLCSNGQFQSILFNFIIIIIINQSAIFMLKFNKSIWRSWSDERSEKRWCRMVEKSGMSTTEQSGSIAFFFWQVHSQGSYIQGVHGAVESIFGRQVWDGSQSWFWNIKQTACMKIPLIFWETSINITYRCHFLEISGWGFGSSFMSSAKGRWRWRIY